MNFSIVNNALSILIILACIFFAYILFFTDKLIGDPYNVNGTRRIILGCILIAYSFFRSIRVYKAFKK